MNVNVGLLGLGTVGSGTANLLANNADIMAERIGRHLLVTHAAAKNLQEAQADLSQIKTTEDGFEVVNDPEVDIVVELIGGYTIAKDLVLKAIENGKHVVTANKALIATHGNEIFAAAKKHHVIVAFEAAVAGGIPVIKALREGLATNRIDKVAGIINGTGNFILTEMRDKGRDFEPVLKEAQQLGYAEADPTFDVEGIDAAHKITILASIAFGIPLNFEKTYTEGISQISSDDLQFARQLGYQIKHLGIAKQSRSGTAVEVRVHPTLIAQEQLLANVNGVMNAVMVHGDAVGPTLYYGAGAGAEPTASAVVADIIDIARQMDAPVESQVAPLGFQPDHIQAVEILPIEQTESAYYLRIQAEDVHAQDKVGVMAQITELLSAQSISINAIVQPDQPESTSPIVLTTDITKEAQIQRAIKAIEALPVINQPVMMIRIESL